MAEHEATENSASSYLFLVDSFGHCPGGDQEISWYQQEIHGSPRLQVYKTLEVEFSKSQKVDYMWCKMWLK